MRRLIDFWSVPHFLAGVLAALTTVVFVLPPVPMFFATLGLAILWELFEARFHLGEVSWNVGSDIVLPLAAFPLTFMLATRSELDTDHVAILFIMTLLLYLYTNVVAWHARINGDADFKS